MMMMCVGLISSEKFYRDYVLLVSQAPLFCNLHLLFGGAHACYGEYGGVKLPNLYKTTRKLNVTQEIQHPVDHSVTLSFFSHF